jgi:hypothetical protein
VKEYCFRIAPRPWAVLPIISNHREDVLKSRLALASLVLLLTIAAAAQSAADRQTLTQARQSYYSLRTQGVTSFQCDVNPDWNSLLQDEREKNPSAADAAVKILSQLHFVVSFGADGKSSMTHNELTGQTEEMNKALAQIYGGMEQMTSGFFDTWSLFMVNKPFPEPDTKFELQTVGPLYTLHYLETGTDVVTTMSKEFAINQLTVTTPQFHSSIHPTLTKSASGFLLSGYDADYDSGKPEELTHLNVLVEYQPVNGVQMLQKLDLKGSYGGSKFSVQLGFQGCQATNKK